MVWLIPIILLAYGAFTYSKRSAATQFFIRLGWAILLMALFAYLFIID